MAHYYSQQKTPTRGFFTKLLVTGCQLAHHRVRAGLYGNHRAVRNLLSSRDSVTQENSDDFAFGIGLDRISSIKHHDAVAGAHQIAFDHRAVSQIHLYFEVKDSVCYRRWKLARYILR